MAERYAVASGDWSDVATWDGGASLPGALDDVYSNTYSVTIDQTVSVATIRSTAGTTASAGGGFVVSTTQTITTTGGFYTDAHPLFSCTNSAGTTVTITGDLQSQGNGDGLLVASGTGDVVFNGDVLGTATNRAQITLSGTGTLTCNGDYQGGYNNYAIHATGAGTLSINGSVTGGISQVTGYGLNVSSLAVVTITGNVTGGNTNAVHITAAADVTVVGDSSANTGYAVESTSATSFITLNGTTTAYGTNPAVKSTGTVIMRGGLLNSISTGLRPVDAPYLLIDSTAELEMEFREDDAGLPGDARSLYTGGTNIGNPATTDVRSGTTFGPASEYTGSLAVPNPSYVSQGVSTDNTVGTLTAAGTLAAGTAQGGSSTTIQLAASESFADDILNGNIVKITGGTGAGQSRMISDYVGSTDTATVAAAWTTTPDNSSTYEIVEGPHIDVSALATAASIAALNDVAATDIVSNGPITTSGGAVSNVTTVATTTTNTDMRGTDNAILAASAPTNFADLAITATTGEVTVATNNDKTGYSISGTKTTLDDLNDVSSASVADAVFDEATAGHVIGGTFGKMLVSIYDSQIAADGQINDVSATTTSFVTNLTEASDDHYNDAVITFTTGNLSGQSRVISDYDGATKTVTLDEALTEAPADGDEFLINTGHVHTESNIANAVLTQQMTESYAADGVAPTLTQAVMLIQQGLLERNVSQTTETVRKLDKTTVAATYTLDDATNPTDKTRAT